jgi:hypothetical protein
LGWLGGEAAQPSQINLLSPEGCERPPDGPGDHFPVDKSGFRRDYIVKVSRDGRSLVVDARMAKIRYRRAGGPCALVRDRQAAHPPCAKKA